MILSAEELKHLVQNEKLVEGLHQDELENAVGTGFDFRVGELYKIAGETHIGESHRITPDAELIALIGGPVSSHVLRPGEYYLMKTVEKVNLPDDIMLVFHPRSTFFRSGISIHTGLADPGFRGQLTFGIINFSKSNLTLEMGARIAHGIFLRVSGSNPYTGIWQDGRMT